MESPVMDHKGKGGAVVCTSLNATHGSFRRHVFPDVTVPCLSHSVSQSVSQMHHKTRLMVYDHSTLHIIVHIVEYEYGAESNVLPTNQCSCVIAVHQCASILGTCWHILIYDHRKAVLEDKTKHRSGETSTTKHHHYTVLKTKMVENTEDTQTIAIKKDFLVLKQYRLSWVHINTMLLLYFRDKEKTGMHWRVHYIVAKERQLQFPHIPRRAKNTPSDRYFPSTSWRYLVSAFNDEKVNLNCQ